LSHEQKYICGFIYNVHYCCCCCCCYRMVSKSWKVRTYIKRLQNIKSNENFFSGSELLNEDTQTDRQIDRQGKTEMCYFEVCLTHKVLQVIAAWLTGRLQHNLSYHWPCRSKVQHAVKKQNMTTVHILTLHSVLISFFSFCTQQTPKISEH